MQKTIDHNAIIAHWYADLGPSSSATVIAAARALLLRNLPGLIYQYGFEGDAFAEQMAIFENKISAYEAKLRAGVHLGSSHTEVNGAAIAEVQAPIKPKNFLRKWLGRLLMIVLPLVSFIVLHERTGIDYWVFLIIHALIGAFIIRICVANFEPNFHSSEMLGVGFKVFLVISGMCNIPAVSSFTLQLASHANPFIQKITAQHNAVAKIPTKLQPYANNLAIKFANYQRNFSYFFIESSDWDTRPLVNRDIIHAIEIPYMTAMKSAGQPVVVLKINNNSNAQINTFLAKVRVGEHWSNTLRFNMPQPLLPNQTGEAVAVLPAEYAVLVVKTLGDNLQWRSDALEVNISRVGAKAFHRQEYIAENLDKWLDE